MKKRFLSAAALCVALIVFCSAGVSSRGSSFGAFVGSTSSVGSTLGASVGATPVSPVGSTPGMRPSYGPDPSAHTLRPSSKISRKSPYRASKNFGKRIAVFGGSLSVNPESDAAKQIWADLLGAEVVTYGVGGAGFAREQGYSLQRQVDEAEVFDVYVLWASTNDYMNGRECGTWQDYTVIDGYDVSRLSTQCGGINYCIKKLLEKNPRAEIYFFTSLRFFSRDSGCNPFSSEVNPTGKTFADYVQAQKDCCAYYGIPVLDQFSLQGINRFNVGLYYKEDLLHMTEEGYSRIGPVQAAFLAGGF